MDVDVDLRHRNHASLASRYYLLVGARLLGCRISVGVLRGRRGERLFALDDDAGQPRHDQHEAAYDAHYHDCQRAGSGRRLHASYRIADGRHSGGVVSLRGRGNGRARHLCLVCAGRAT